MAIAVKGENVYLKQYSFVSSSWVTRMQFINGLKKVFKEKQLKEFSGLDFVQFVTLLCNDFDRRVILDILFCYGSKLNSVCTKTEEQLLSQTYSHDRLVDHFSLYFFYLEFMKEAKKLVDGDSKPPAQLMVTIGLLRDKLFESAAVKPYERHILYKILVILSGKNREKESTVEYKLYEDNLMDSLNQDKDKKVPLYSFIAVLCKYCIEARILMNSIQKHYKTHHESFVKSADFLLEMDEDEDLEQI